MSELERIRAGVIAAGKALREAWPPPSDGPYTPGSTIVLLGVDPTVQAPHEAGRAILHKVAGKTRVAIPMDMQWAQRVGHLREIQTLMGFAREDRWDALGTVLEVREARDGGDPELVVQLGPIWVHHQLLLEEGGGVPGLDAAIKDLDKLQAGVVVPNATPKPDALLPLLFKILETHHWRAFRDIYDRGASLSDKKVAFEQFKHAWEVSAGKVVFDGYVEPQLFVDEAVEGTIVRTRLQRSGEKGEALTRPIKWVKRGAGWRLAGGLM